MNPRSLIPIVVIAMTCFVAVATPQDPTPGESVESALARVQDGAGGSARIRIHAGSGTARLLDFGSVGLAVESGRGVSLLPRDRADLFLERFGAAFGVRSAAAELEYLDSRSDRAGMTHVTYRQIHRGVPVFGGEMRFHFNARDRLSAVTGLFVPDLVLSVVPVLTPEEALTVALSGQADPLEGFTPAAERTKLWVYRSGLAQGVPGTNHLVYEAIVPGPRLRERVFVDARDGGVVDRMPADHEIDRQIYLPGGGDGPSFVGHCVNGTCDNDGSSCIIDDRECQDGCDAAPRGPDCVWDESDPLDPNGNFVCGSDTPNCPPADPVLQTDVEAGVTRLIQYSRDTFGFFLSTFRRWSWDDDNGPMHSILQVEGDGQIGAVVSCRYAPNAVFRTHPPFTPNWEMVSTIYCLSRTDADGVIHTAADDIVAHEWGHGYTLMTHGLVYAYQPGALNEAYSDIWGEVIDLLNGKGPSEIHTLRTAESCSELDNKRFFDTDVLDDSHRWLMGEDATAFGGPIRDMWHPNCHGNPGHTTDLEYNCRPESPVNPQGRIVHTNSGVPAHAFVYLVDGSRDEGPGGVPPETVTGIGMTKAVHIYWRAQTVYQDSMTDFVHHADMLELSCRSLIGQYVENLDVEWFLPAEGCGNGQPDPGEQCDDGNNQSLDGCSRLCELEQRIVQADCDELASAIDAVGLRIVVPLSASGPCEHVPLCPDERECEGGPDCDVIGCRPSSVQSIVDLGAPRCFVEQDQFFECPEGERAHVLYTQCEFCECCDDVFPCICPNSACAPQIELVCQGDVPSGEVEQIDLRLDVADGELTLEWTEAGLGYDVVHGDLGVLRATAGDFVAATAGCLADNLMDTTLSDAPADESPLMFFVVRSGAGGLAPYDSDGPTQQGSRDLEILSSPDSCED